VFLVLHVWVTSAAVGSRAVYDRQLGWLHGGPFMGLLEVVLVLVPLAYHAVYGVLRTLRPRDPEHAYTNDLMYMLQRASGIVVLAFVVAHVWEFRGQTFASGLPVALYSTKLVDDLSSTSSGVPWIALGYLVGIGATVFHLVNGLTAFWTARSRETGTTHEATHARVLALFRATGVLLFVVCAGLVVQLATGARWFPVEPRDGSQLACGSAALTPPPPARAAAAAPSSSSPAPSTLPAADR
jgi:succinate dehydrogenase / fumarate reductase cytochrome b subunit